MGLPCHTSIRQHSTILVVGLSLAVPRVVLPMAVIDDPDAASSEHSTPIPPGTPLATAVVETSMLNDRRSVAFIVGLQLRLSLHANTQLLADVYV